MALKSKDSRGAVVASATGALGVLMGFTAISLNGIWLVLLWPATSLMVVSAGYAFFGPAVCGKMQNGQRKKWATALHLPSIMFSHAMWNLGRLAKPDDPWNEIAPALYVGRKLDNGSQLPPRTSMIVDLTAEYTEPNSVVETGKYRCIPTLDGTAKISTNYGQILREALEEPGTIYVHCAVGYGRSAMFAANLLIAKGLASDAEAAEKVMQRRRRRIRLRPSHKEVIRLHSVAESGAQAVPSEMIQRLGSRLIGKVSNRGFN